MKPIYVLLSILLFCVNGVSAAQETYYIFDTSTKTLKRVSSGNMSDANTDEWAIWLYKLGQRVGGRDNWGVIVGQTPGEVLSDLQKNQKFEQRFNKWAGSQTGKDDLTYFNPLGPIAIIRPSFSGFSKLMDKAREVNEKLEKYQQMRESYQAAAEMAFNSDTSALNSPLQHVGEVLRDYGNALGVATHKSSALYEQLFDLSANSTLDITESLNQIDFELSGHAESFSPVQSLLSVASGRLKNNFSFNENGDIITEGWSDGPRGNLKIVIRVVFHGDPADTLLKTYSGPNTNIGVDSAHVNPNGTIDATLSCKDNSRCIRYTANTGESALAYRVVFKFTTRDDLANFENFLAYAPPVRYFHRWIGP